MYTHKCCAPNPQSVGEQTTSKKQVVKTDDEDSQKQLDVPSKKQVRDVKTDDEVDLLKRKEKYIFVLK